LRSFSTDRYFPADMLAQITDLRVENPGLVKESLSLRLRRKKLTEDGKLVILAADHPARMVTAVGADPVAMGDRTEYLGRILRVLAASEVDGLMATSDVIDDVVLANHLYTQAGGKSLLDGRLLIGSMNRGGLAGVAHELFDPITSYTSAKRIKSLGLDGAKLLLRLGVAEEGRDNDDFDTIETLRLCAVAIEECSQEDLPVFLEPLAVTKSDGGYTTSLEPNENIQAIGVGQALGSSTMRTWLKIPYTREFERVVAATTLPILMLGGPAKGDVVSTLETVADSMSAGPNVRGALIGRNVLFPGDDDPAVVAQAVHEIVHRGLPVQHALASARKFADGESDDFLLV